MEVLCLGLSRTGTMSTYAGLRQLGLNPYHCVEMGRDNSNMTIRKWRKQIEAKYFNGAEQRWKTADDFDEVLWPYDATTDIPCVLFVDELLAAYPNAKVILTERDTAGWIKSVEATFLPILRTKMFTHFLEYIDFEHCYDYFPVLRYSLHVWSGGNWSDTARLGKGYEEHNAYVKSVVPQERLLVWHARDGWEPLCKHLGKPVPDKPFPKINEGDFAAKLHKKVVLPLRLLAVTTKLLKVMAPIVVAWLGWWAYGRGYGDKLCAFMNAFQTTLLCRT